MVCVDVDLNLFNHSHSSSSVALYIWAENTFINVTAQVVDIMSTCKKNLKNFKNIQQRGFASGHPPNY